MDPRRRALLLLIAIGGTGVLASYLLAFALEPSIRTGLWGELPEAWRGYYTINMLLAAVGFFPLTYWLALATPIESFADYTGTRFEVMVAAYAAILMPSALWLPLTALYLGSPSTPLWWGIRVVLLLVGLAASVLGWLLIRRARRGPGRVWVAVVAFFFFWLQTMVLDALVWPVYFR